MGGQDFYQTARESELVNAVHRGFAPSPPEWAKCEDCEKPFPPLMIVMGICAECEDAYMRAAKKAVELSKEPRK